MKCPRTFADIKGNWLAKRSNKQSELFSIGGMNNTHSPSPECLALPAADVAKLLTISERHLWALHSSGRLPRPIRLGRSVRWNHDELRRWLDAGCPDRATWEANRGGA